MEPKTATHPFICRLSGDLVKTGDLYIEQDGLKVCLKCGLPVKDRNLIPLKEYQARQLSLNKVQL